MVINGNNAVTDLGDNVHMRHNEDWLSNKHKKLITDLNPVPKFLRRFVSDIRFPKVVYPYRSGSGRIHTG